MPLHIYIHYYKLLTQWAALPVQNVWANDMCKINFFNIIQYACCIIIGIAFMYITDRITDIIVVDVDAICCYWFKQW